MFYVTLLIIAATCIISFLAFSNERLMDHLIFYPPAITKDHQWYRFFTCGLIHANTMHLAFNMYSFYIFGSIIEKYFIELFPIFGGLFYLLLYVSSLLMCLIPTYLMNRNNAYYKSLGASGAVSAIVFAFIFLQPTQDIGLIFIPNLYAPAFIFGLLYLIVTAIMAYRSHSHINHSAHLWGGIYGIIFTIFICQFQHNFSPLNHFVSEIRNYFLS